MEVIYDHGEPTETTVAFTTAITNRAIRTSRSPKPGGMTVTRRAFARRR
ncbi:MAG: hypothetical protein ACLTYN_02145 [Dysosmobacter welbionis]